VNPSRIYDARICVGRKDRTVKTRRVFRIFDESQQSMKIIHELAFETLDGLTSACKFIGDASFQANAARVWLTVESKTTAPQQ